MKAKNLLAALGFGAALALSGCEDLPTDVTPKSTTIIYEVQGSGGMTHADIIYGDEKYLGNDNFLTWLCTTQMNVQLPRAYTNISSLGHPVKLAVNATNPNLPGNITLSIQDTLNKKVYEEFFMPASYYFYASYANLEYYIPNSEN